MIGLERQIKIMQIGYISGEHILFISPPGTAKSMLARLFSASVKKRFFGYLLTKFTTPDEIFGPIAIEEYKKGKLVRITTNKLPECEIAFLDEIFKASSSILNSLLTIINERIFYNPEPQRVPLRTVIAASNEIPDDPSLMALYDRFLFRYFYDYLPKEQIRTLVEFANNFESEEELLKLIPPTPEPPEKLQKLPESLIDLTINIFSAVEFNISDRRKVKIVKALRALYTADFLSPETAYLTFLTAIPSTKSEQIQLIDILTNFFPNKESLIEKFKSEINKILASSDDIDDISEKIKKITSLSKAYKGKLKDDEYHRAIEEIYMGVIKELTEEKEEGAQ